MKKLLLTLLLCASLAFAGAGTVATFAAGSGTEENDSALPMKTALTTVDGFKSNGSSQVRTTENLTGEYSVLYSINGNLPNNGWIAQQFIGLDEEGTYLQINLFVDSAITVTKIKNGASMGDLPILSTETNEPISNPRTLELGGGWFTGAEYIFKYEVTETRLNFYFGPATDIVEGTEAPVSRGYVALDAETYGEYTDGLAAFAPYANDRKDFDMTINYMTVNSAGLDLDMNTMEGADNTEVIGNDDVTLFVYEDFENISSASVGFKKDDTYRKSWVSAEPVSTAELPDDANVFTASFEINFTTSNGNYFMGLQSGFVFGMPSRDATENTQGVTSIVTKFGNTGLDLKVGNGTSSEVVENGAIGDASMAVGANQNGVTTYYVTMRGTKDGSLTVTYDTNLTTDQEVVCEFTGINFDGYVSFFVEAANVVIAGEGTNGTLAFNNIKLPSMELVEATGITLSESNIAVSAGDTHQLVATIQPENTTIQTVAWTSSNEEVATVDENGLVTAKAAGSALITATTDNGLTATCNVLVPVEVTEVKLDKSTGTISVGRTLQLTATVSPDDASDKTITWTSSNNEVAKVDSKGLVTGVATGTATITATSVNGKTATCEITVVVGVTSVSLDKNEATLEIGGTVNLTATILPENAGNKNVTWVSSDLSVASVENGTVTAKAAGTAVISVITEDGKKEATCTVTVEAPVVEVTGVTLDKTEATLDVGGTIVLKATVAPGDATNKSISWKSSDTSVAVVDDNGVVTAVKAGTATITVTTENGKTATCTITVNGNDEQTGGCSGVVFGASGIIAAAVSLTGVILLRKKQH